jgi:hypothetical protein
VKKEREKQRRKHAAGETKKWRLARPIKGGRHGITTVCGEVAAETAVMGKDKARKKRRPTQHFKEKSSFGIFFLAWRKSPAQQYRTHAARIR